uniref:GPCR kinase n=1 Tax=Tanacetum cinerariifolium TaxID=118510 RepID=A0A699HS82_TANCI|nr:GPCR kinase [Tanacetum cinerariifolium]
MWRLRIKQYFQIQDYALWDVIENGNSFKPVAETTTDDVGTSTTIILGPVTIEEKAKKKNDVKARIAKVGKTMNSSGVLFIGGKKYTGFVQQTKLLTEKVCILDSEGAFMSTQEYMQKVAEDVGEDEDFNCEAWVSATNYVIAHGGIVIGGVGDIDNFLKNGKLEQVVRIVKSCSLNVIGDLTVTINDISGTIPRTTYYKVIGKGGYGKDINVGAAMILVNVSIFTPKPSKHYLNITKKNVVNVFRKDTVFTSGSG